MNHDSTLVNSNDSLNKLAPNKAVEYESQIRNLDVFKYYRSKHENFNLSRLIDESLRPKLTGTTLMGEDKINFRGNGLFFIDDKFLIDYNDIETLSPQESNFSITFFQLGKQLSGHENIVHGGLLATLLDELTCRLAFQNFHSKKGVTANLNINYKRPCYTNSMIMIKCQMSKKVGRKCWIKGLVYKLKEYDNDVENLELLTECECLVIEPKWVKEL